MAARLFEALSSAAINVDLIIQSLHDGSSNDITFTVAERDLDQARQVTSSLLDDLGGELAAEGGMTKLSIRGAGIMGRPGIAAKLFSCLSQQGINLRLIATSEVKVSCVIDSAAGRNALQAVQDAFDVTDNQVKRNPAVEGEGEPEVRGVALDRDQAQLSVSHVPDRPGTAAALCSALADAGISLDAIVQSERQHGDGSRDISFILRRDDRARADVVLAPLLAQWPGAALEESSGIARVSAVGAGMPATAGTAGRMFRPGGCRHQHRPDRHQRNPHQLRCVRAGWCGCSPGCACRLWPGRWSATPGRREQLTPRQILRGDTTGSRQPQVVDPEFQQRYQDAEQAFAEARYADARGIAADLLAELENAPTDAETQAAVIGWRAFVALLLGNIELHGLGQPEPAARHFQLVLDSQPHDTLAELAQQGLDWATQPKATTITPTPSGQLASEGMPEPTTPRQLPEPAPLAQNKPTQNLPLPDLLRDPFLQGTPTSSADPTTVVSSAMPWLEHLATTDEGDQTTTLEQARSASPTDATTDLPEAINNKQSSHRKQHLTPQIKRKTHRSRGISRAASNSISFADTRGISRTSTNDCSGTGTNTRTTAGRRTRTHTFT